MQTGEFYNPFYSDGVLAEEEQLSFVDSGDLNSEINSEDGSEMSQSSDYRFDSHSESSSDSHSHSDPEFLGSDNSISEDESQDFDPVDELIENLQNDALGEYIEWDLYSNLTPEHFESALEILLKIYFPSPVEFSDLDLAVLRSFKEILNHFKIEFSKRFISDNLSLAIEANNYTAMEFFLDHSPHFATQMILSEAIRLSSANLVKIICKNTESAKSDNIINFLRDNGGAKLIQSCKDFYAEELQQFSSNKSLLTYPGMFNGDLRLSMLRQEIAANFSLFPSQKIAANLLGVNLSNAYSHSLRNLQHNFGLARSETYHRSAENPFALSLGPKSVRFISKNPDETARLGAGMGIEAHFGLYQHPLDALNESKGIVSVAKLPAVFLAQDPKVSLYDEILNYKNSVCDYIQTHAPFSNSILISHQNHYPCLMVFIKPSALAKKKKASDFTLEAWTEIVISYFRGLVNYLAEKKGFDLELLRRSSFGFLTPTIAPCGPSFRINIGIIPLEYAAVLIEALKILDHTLGSLDLAISNKKLNKKFFIFAKDYPKYLGVENFNSSAIKNLLDLCWAQTEKGGKTTIVNLMRTPNAREMLSALVHQNLNSSEILSELQYSEIFITALEEVLLNVKIKTSGKKITLSFDQNKFKFEPRVTTNLPKIISDMNFWNLIKLIAGAIEKQFYALVANGLQNLIELRKNNISEVDKKIVSANVNGLYDILSMANELLYAQSITSQYRINNAVQESDEYGSDSEVEGNPDPEQQPNQKIYARKIIVQNGMRAILAALYASDFMQGTSCYLQHGAYYEIEKALKAFTDLKCVPNINQAEILIADLNSCVTDPKSKSKSKSKLELGQLDISKIKILILDSTSATTLQQHEWLRKFNHNETEVMFLVSSGFKNEQLGADKNPYGTIRIFTKNLDKLLALVDRIKQNDHPIKSHESHQARRLYKGMGCTPRNRELIESARKRFRMR